MKLTFAWAACACFATAAPALAANDAYTSSNDTEGSWVERNGASVSAGGGIFNFSDGNARDVTSLGGVYTARVAVGTKRPLTLEVAYLGTAQDIDAVGLSRGAALLSNGVEGALRLNLTPMFEVTPYILGGAAWKHYNIVNDDVNLSSIRESDNVLEIPVGAGIAWHRNNFLVDGRFDYRFATDEELFVNDGLDNWALTLRAGFEF